MCAGGFIEELPPNGTNERGQSTSSSDDVEMANDYDSQRLNDRISSLFMSSIGGLRSNDEENGDASSNQDGSTSSKWHICFFFGLNSLHDCNNDYFVIFCFRRPTS